MLRGGEVGGMVMIDGRGGFLGDVLGKNVSGEEE